MRHVGILLCFIPLVVLFFILALFNILFVCTYKRFVLKHPCTLFNKCGICKCGCDPWHKIIFSDPSYVNRGKKT